MRAVSEPRPSQLNAVFDRRRRVGAGALSRLAVLCLPAVLSACATHTWYRRAPEAERSAHLAHAAVREGMTLVEVVQSMVEVRSMGQDASLVFSCPESRVWIVLHAGEELARMGSRRVYAAGFASIQVEDFKKQSFSSWGFQRQGEFVSAVRTRESELLACDRASLAFNAVPEGGCGHDALDLVFAPGGRLSSIGSVRGSTCER